MREYQRRSGEMPADRRSSGKQKRLHALLPLICLRVLSTAGSVSLTLPPPPPCWPLYLHLIPPSPPQPPPLLPLACRGPRYQARADVRGARRGRGPGGRRRRLIAQQRLPPHRLWEPWTQPSPTRWPPPSTRKTYAEVFRHRRLF